MRTYENKDELKNEINKSFAKYISEFNDIPEPLKDKRIDEVDRTPAENLAYQVGWTTLILKWEADERMDSSTTSLARSGVFSSATSIISNLQYLLKRLLYSPIASLKYFSFIFPTVISVIFIFAPSVLNKVKKTLLPPKQQKGFLASFD